jgi:hypothetical protein
MEDLHRGGLDVTRQSGKIGYLVSAGSNAAMDKYGRIFTYR